MIHNVPLCCKRKARNQKWPGAFLFPGPYNIPTQGFFQNTAAPQKTSASRRALAWSPIAELLDKRLLALGLACKALGKVVATHAARHVAMCDRFEIRRGSDARHLVSAAMLETDTDEEALSTTWAMARRDVGSRWQSCLVLEPVSGGWTIFLPPPRAWPGCSIRPYVLCLMRL